MEAGMYQQQQAMILKSHGSGCALLENLQSRWDLIFAQSTDTDGSWWEEWRDKSAYRSDE